MAGAGAGPPRVTLRPRAARPFFARHPWVYVSSIDRVEGQPAAGDEVAVESAEGRFIARGLYNPAGALRVRLYRWEDAAIDREFWAGRIAAALRWRAAGLGLECPGRAFRAINSEGDFLSGLTVDRYDRWVVVQVSSLALAARREDWLGPLLEATGAAGALIRWDRRIAEQEGIDRPEDEVVGDLPDAPVPIEEHGLDYRVDLRRGQKTGMYLDQARNRLEVARLAGGRSVLDLFCYTGGFGLTALRHGGATEVLGVDRSRPAVEVARGNAARNGLEGARFEAGPVPEAVDRLRAEGRRFGLVICDPPKFAGSARELDDALRGYVRLNQSVLGLVAPDGVLATCSCSGHVGQELFTQVVARAAELAGRRVQIVARHGAAPDHPLAATCLESDYLKCYVLRVD